MKVGLALPHYDFSFPSGDFSFPSEQPATVARVVEYARRAEQLGFDSVWVSDHLFLDLAKYGGPPKRYGTPEATAMLTALAAATTHVRFGSLVLCASFRHEFNAAGIPFGSAGQRIDRLSVVAGQLDARLDPRPAIIVGGKGGPKLARVVAEHADAWNVCWRITPDEYRARLGTLHQACARAKRDPQTVGLSVGLYTLLGTDRNDLEARYEALQRWTPGGALDGVPLAKHADGALVGTIEDCAATIKEFEALGVSEIILSAASLPFSVYDDDQLELAARELIPQVRG